MILVYGANGVQGRPVATQLLRAGHPVRVLVRNVTAARELEALGNLDIIEGNLFSRADLQRASQNVDAVALLQPLSGLPDQRLEFMHAAVQAAQESGVHRLVFNTGIRVPEQTTPARELELKRQSEEMVQRSGISWGIVRPPVYLENLLQLPTLNSIRNGVLAHPASPETPLAWVAADDVASGVVAALQESESRAWDVGGPQALTGPEMAQVLSGVTGKAIRYESIPLDAFEMALNAAYGPPVGTDIADVYRYLESHRDWMAPTGADGLPVAVQSAHDWAKHHLSVDA